MAERKTCVSCATVSPEIHEASESTLTTNLGWRVRRARVSTDRWVLEWRCPGCWKKLKDVEASGAPPPPIAAHPPSQRRRSRWG